MLFKTNSNNVKKLEVIKETQRIITPHHQHLIKLYNQLLNKSNRNKTINKIKMKPDHPELYA